MNDNQKAKRSEDPCVLWERDLGNGITGVIPITFGRARICITKDLIFYDNVW